MLVVLFNFFYQVISLFLFPMMLFNKIKLELARLDLSFMNSNTVVATRVHAEPALKVIGRGPEASEAYQYGRNFSEQRLGGRTGYV